MPSGWARTIVASLAIAAGAAAMALSIGSLGWVAVVLVSGVVGVGEADVRLVGSFGFLAGATAAPRSQQHNAVRHRHDSLHASVRAARSIADCWRLVRIAGNAGAMAELPVSEVLPDLLAALRDGTRALLVAPPGAGKTTMVAPALLGRAVGEGWPDPAAGPAPPRRPRRRRIHRRATWRTARRDVWLCNPARQQGRQGDTRHRHDPRRLPRPHPGRPGTQGRCRRAVRRGPRAQPRQRPGLGLRARRGGRRCGPTCASSRCRRPWTGRASPNCSTTRRASSAKARLSADHRTCRARTPPRASSRRWRPPSAARLAEHDGSLLAFLPGVAEIERTADALGPLGDDIVLHRLHGAIEPAAQREALAPPPPGKRKLVLASAIAETSLTLDDVRIVVDSGLARRPRYDRGAGLTRLVTERASRAAVTQRAGRAARQAPGHRHPPVGRGGDRHRCRRRTRRKSSKRTCRLWSSPAYVGRGRPGPPPFLDPPPAAALAEARRRLAALGALDEAGRLTAARPRHCRLAARAAAGAHDDRGRRRMGFEAAAAGAPPCSPSAALAAMTPTLNCAAPLALGQGPARQCRPAHGRQLGQARRRQVPVISARAGQGRRARLPRSALPPPRRERRALAVGRRPRFPARPHLSAWRAANGWRSPRSPGHASGARILSAAALEESDVLELFGERIETRHDGAFDPRPASVTPTRSRRLGAIRLSSGPDPKPDQAAIEAALVDGVREHGLELLPWSESALAHCAPAPPSPRASIPQFPSLDEEALIERLDEWLPPLVAGKRGLTQVDAAALRRRWTAARL